jgi:hypothetical protein
VPCHFCGQVLDLARHCTLAGMRLWADSDEVTPGYWFRAEEGALVLPGHHPWRKRSTWCVGQGQADGPGEIYPPQAAYYKGGNPLGYPGTSACGPADALLHGGIHGVHPALQTEPDGSLAACFVPHPLPPLTLHYYGSAFRVSSTVGHINAVSPFSPPPAGTLAVMTFGQVGFFSPVTAPTIPGWTLLADIVEVSSYVRLGVWYRLIDGTETWPYPFTLSNDWVGFGYMTAVPWPGPVAISATIAKKVAPVPYFDGSFIPISEDSYVFLFTSEYNGVAPTNVDDGDFEFRAEPGSGGGILPVSYLGTGLPPQRVSPITTGTHASGYSWSIIVLASLP